MILLNIISNFCAAWLKVVIVKFSDSWFDFCILFWFLVRNKADDFNESLEDIHKWLPLAEAELKFCAIPNDEDGIIRLIENHEVFVCAMIYLNYCQ